MTTELYLKCFVACLIGNLIHVAFKIASLSKDYEVANMPFSLGLYLKKDKWALIFDAIGSFALVYVADEIIQSPYIMDKIKLVFILIGIGGSYVVMQIFSVAKKQFRGEVDKKTNLADFGTEEKPKK